MNAFDTIFYTTLTPNYTTGKWCQRCGAREHKYQGGYAG